LTAFIPQKTNGKSVIICPGGGYQILAFDKEGTRVAEMLNQWGYAAFVLKYRLPDDTTQVDKSLAPLMDAQQSIRMVRKKAAEWGLNPNKIGIMGFSAGGHLAATASTHFMMNLGIAMGDTTSVRPDFSVLVYPVISFDTSFCHMGSRTSLIGKNPNKEKADLFSNEKQINAQTPPAFLVHAGDDKAVPVENSIRYYQACIKNGVSAEMHLYPAGGHGFGLLNKTTKDDWTERLKHWLELF
jgi:dienelactone hydrolase